MSTTELQAAEPDGHATLDEHQKIAVDTLYKEFQRIQAKSVATDDWFFRFLSIAVIPFFAFLGYCAITPVYRILVAALPVLSIVGLMVVSVLSSHYLFVGVYGGYLQREINRILGLEVMHEATFGEAAYNRFTPVNVSYALGLTLLVFLNLAAGPFISRELSRFALGNVQTFGTPQQVVVHYWLSVGVFLVITLTAGVGSFAATRRRLAHIAITHSTTSTAGPTTGRRPFKVAKPIGGLTPMALS